MGQRQRYRLLDLERLSWRLRTDDLEAARQNFVLEETIAPNQFQRQACWTESLVVGNIGFVERIQPLILSRRRFFRRHQTQNRPGRKLFVTIGEFFFRTL